MLLFTYGRRNDRMIISDQTHKERIGMRRYFNTEGLCKPDEHYMVRLDDRLERIKRLFIDRGKYFVINRGRQYGKTTLLRALAEYLREDYLVFSMDFQMMSSASFENEKKFVKAFTRDFVKAGIDKGDESVLEELTALENGGFCDMDEMFVQLGRICRRSKLPVVMMVDEVDSASNNQVFLDFLGQLRDGYLNRHDRTVFWSVILAGVYDIKNLKQKIRPDGEHKYNSPWNIAADFNVEMKFSTQDIAGMLEEYEQDHQTGMEIAEIAELIYEYTEGYPYMVSRICQLMDEELAGAGMFPDTQSVWTKNGVQEAVKLFLSMNSVLFDDMVKKLTDFPKLKEMLKEILFRGREYIYERDNPFIDLGIMFGFLKQQNHTVRVANRIFEMKLYNLFLSEEETENPGYDAGDFDKNQFMIGTHLNMELVMTKFAEHFTEIYGDYEEKFLEENGRRFFLLYLRPIINGTGNYYVEAQTRDRKRTDIIVDYLGEQFVIELKIWRGEEYQNRGKQQLFEYLEYYHQDKGYLLSFHFNRKKQTGVRRIAYQGKEIVEVVV